MAEETGSRDWAWLPDHILDSILKNLASLQDYLWFSTVCKPWHAAAEAQKRRRIATSPQKQVPLLLVPTQDRSHEWRSLYCTTRDDRLLPTKLRIPWQYRRCCGSSHGWLAFEEDDFGITLYNPFTGARISLPPVTLYNPLTGARISLPRLKSQYLAKKVVLSADPSTHPQDYMVAAVLKYDGFRTLVVIRPGRDDQNWTHFTQWTNSTCLQGWPLLAELIVHDGDWIYATGDGGVLARANVQGVGTADYQPRLELVVPKWCNPLPTMALHYIVEPSRGDELLMIVRWFENIGNKYGVATRLTNDIKVFKLVGDGGGEVEDLNGDAVFIGDSHSVAIPATEFEGCEADTVYYTEDHEDVAHNYDQDDIGKFNIKNKRFKVLSKAPDSEMPHPIWIFPTLKQS
ncbi:unnamed protein product [Linum tenue]|uniref:KIB1-4 beta-propeller domain-containing protein n=1 Tax=Linum tenue TaxID=586396 RepID=A0AAV0ISL4_9ROSI|nr:unnamed protein product [Linum tenue]